MTSQDVLKELEAKGTAQNRKVYPRHGVKGELFGVSYADLGKLTKKYRGDTELARALWASGNHDARVLATMIADPEGMKSGEIDAWLRDLDNYVLTDALAKLVSKTPFAETKLTKWARSKSEWAARAGYVLLSQDALKAHTRPQSFYTDYLKRIESDIHSSKNQVRDAMNSALIAIGLRSPALEKRALAAAKRIGKVEVDHGETGCKTPDATAYIQKAKARRKAQ